VRAGLLRGRRRVGRVRLGVISVAVIGAVGVAGCEPSENADTERGRALFQTNCGTCHALGQAGTSAQVGPDLDAAFAQARTDGMDNDTIEGVVQKQIAHPREIEKGANNYDQVYMPADIVTGEDAEDVATYVASVAGVPGAKPPPLGTPDQVFAEKCGGCHSLVAGAGSGVGPNLADALKGEDAQFVHEQIVDPNSDIYQGFQPNVMPQDFEQQIPGKNLDELVDYILKQVEGGGGG
jgi:mono/diheme cytochrome c family protein